MNTNHRPRSTAPRQYERILLAYSSALDRSDFATVAEILARANDDPLLERLILELNAAHAAELSLTTPIPDAPYLQARPKENRMLIANSLRYPQRRSFAAAALLITILAALMIGGLAWIPFQSTFLTTLSTPTLAPTNTPTPQPPPPQLPVVPISAANVQQVGLVQIMGRGYFSGGFAWSGNTLAVTSPVGISLYNTDDLSAAPFVLHYEANLIGFSVDGKTMLTFTMVNGGGEITGTITRWNAYTHQMLSTATIPLGTDGAWFADFVADDTLLPFLMDGKLHFYNVLTEQIAFELNGTEPLQVTGVTLSPDGKYAAAGTVDEKLHLWEVAKPEREKFILTDAEEQIYSMAFTPDSQHLITVDNRLGTLRQWDMKTGKQQSLASADGSVFDIEFSPTEKQYVTANQDGTIDVYNAETHRPFISLTGHVATATEGRAVARFAFNDDGSQLASVGDNGTIKLWDMRGGQEIAQLDSQFVCPDQLGYSADGKRMLAMCEDLVQVWDTDTFTLMFSTRTEIAGINSARISADGTLVAFTENRGVVQVWEVDTNKRTLIHEIPYQAASQGINGGGTFTSRLAFSHDGTRLAFAHPFDSLVWLYDLASGEEQSIAGHTQAIYSLNFTPDNSKLFSASADGSARVWNITNNGLIALRESESAPIIEAQYNADGSLIAVTHENGRLELLDALTLMTRTTLHEPSEDSSNRYYGDLAFTPDGKLLANFSMPFKGGEDVNTVTFWDVQTGEQLTTLTIPINYPRSIAISLDGARLAVSVGGAVLIYAVMP
jgi:WD40 repeat protein